MFLLFVYFINILIDSSWACLVVIFIDESVNLLTDDSNFGVLATLIIDFSFKLSKFLGQYQSTNSVWHFWLTSNMDSILFQDISKSCELTEWSQRRNEPSSGAAIGW